jgi:surfeit locus 1 family protein
LLHYFKLPKIRVQLFGYIFSPGFIPTLTTILLLPILISLGTWQLHRAHEKKLLEHDFAGHRSLVANDMDISSINKNDRYRTLIVTGKFDNQHLIFLDNKTYHQTPGFHVFSPFFTQDQKTLLIDRGFVASKTRQTMPTVAPLLGTRTISGLVYFPSKTFVLKKDDLPLKWPLTLQSIDIKQLRTILQTPILPYYLLLEKGDEMNLVRDWHPVSFPAYRHTGYAIQWFLLALTLVVIYISLNISRE